MNKKTTEEIEELKRGWRSDPNWDVEETAGFEAHKAELKKYRLKCEAEWAQQRVLHRAELAGRICPEMSDSGGSVRCEMENCPKWDKVNECCAIKSRILK